MSAPGVVGSPNAVAVPVDDRQLSQLPVLSEVWPPTWCEPIHHAQRVWDAWWTGDRQRLYWAYYNLGANSSVARSYFATTGEAGISTPRPGQFRSGLLGSIEYSFWGAPTPPGEKRTKTHVPLAGDIAQTSASLLFAKPPVLRSTLGGKAAIANDAYFESLMDDHMHRRLLEAAEMCAALGGVFLRVVWDREVRDRPWIVDVPADVGIPEWRYDVLGAVTFWQVLSDTGDTVVRHLEKHVPGENVILHGLYSGDQTELGQPIPLVANPVTARLASDPTMRGDTITFPDQPFDASSVVYVPNLTPNRIWRDLGPQAWPLGRSDFSGVEGLMDNLDEAYSSWMRDIRLAKARLIVPKEYLDNIGRGKGAVFDPSREVYSPMNMLHDDGGNASNIVMNQFLIRWQEHQQTCQDLINRVVQEAGYSPQTFGDYDGNAPTATEIQARERVSMLTRSKKINYWRPALQDIIYGLMTIEQQMGNSAITPERPDVEFIETISPGQLELAQTAQAMDSAGAASRETLVELMHPDWTPDEVSKEVDRIRDETGISMAAHARIALAAPMGEPLQQEIADLAGSDIPGAQQGVPGTSPDDSSTGGSSDLLS